MNDTIFRELAREFTSHMHHPRYHDPSSPEGSPPMSLLQDLGREFAGAVNWTEDELRARLPTVARLADDAETIAANPVVGAVLSAVHVPPSVLEGVAKMVTDLEAELAAKLQAPAPAEVVAAAEPAAVDLNADPDPAVVQ